MRIEIGRKIEKYFKAKINRLFINKTDFTIISNNCWGTFVYKKFGLEYGSPFVNLVVFAPDYIDLLENFSLELMRQLSFTTHENSKYKDELIRLGLYEQEYPIGILDGRYELHFIHYHSERDAREKWLKRVERMNLKRIIVKFSDGDLFEESMAERFENLAFKNKIAFVAKEFSESPSFVTLEKFRGEERVRDEWKHSSKEFNLASFINNMQENEGLQ